MSDEENRSNQNLRMILEFLGTIALLVFIYFAICR